MLSRNPEIKRLLVMLVLLAGALLLIAAGMSLYSTHMLREELGRSNAAIMGTITASYPDADRLIVQQLQHPEDRHVQAGKVILAKYGLDASDLLETGSDLIQRSFRVNLALYAALAVLACCGFTAVLLFTQQRHYNKLQQITAYAEKVAGGDDSLDIRDNDEGDLSILKNEIYKITTMLREQSELSEQDKLSLAASIADISHQLRTPMTSLFVLNDLLQEGPGEEKTAEFLSRMRGQLKRMDWLVTSLLKLSKLDAGTAAMKQEPYELRALVNKALDTLSIPLEIKMIDAVVEEQRSEGAAGGTPIMLTGDFNWTCEALINILKNAVEHTPEHGQVRIAILDNPIYTRLEITDTGEGIDREDLPYIFNRFYKGKNAGDDSVGIGLAMTHAIIRTQGGDITVQSEQGEGTTFTITFFKTVGK
ncbi:sensor histidine kinase [Paenibacillus tarimensis]|uniref:sensor histidine kinase n=1 Tax=Paenibacillus tarimensis TaxID=416012 RepID=UPI001F1C1C5B|nr:HAMP domain-containing sensor histidine kinase [Paenibacillus tarimensis]MCF2945343.1 HAMP domain-containing histidine kinase [Paenibacillus tarimensis]